MDVDVDGLSSGAGEKGLLPAPLLWSLYLCRKCGPNALDRPESKESVQTLPNPEWTLIEGHRRNE